MVDPGTQGTYGSIAYFWTGAQVRNQQHRDPTRKDLEFQKLSWLQGQLRTAWSIIMGQSPAVWMEEYLNFKRWIRILPTATRNSSVSLGDFANDQQTGEFAAMFVHVLAAEILFFSNPRTPGQELQPRNGKWLS